MSKGLRSYIREGIQQGLADFLEGRRARAVRAEPDADGLWARLRKGLRRWTDPEGYAQELVDSVLQKEIENLRREVEAIGGRRLEGKDWQVWADNTFDVLDIYAKEIAAHKGRHVAISRARGVVASSDDPRELLSQLRKLEDRSDIIIYQVPTGNEF